MPKWVELVFDVRVTTRVSYFVLDRSPDLPTERETFLQRWCIALRKLLALATPQLAIPAAAEVLFDYGLYVISCNAFIPLGI